MEKDYTNYNPQNIDVEELILVVDLIEKTELELKKLKEQKNGKLNDPEIIKGINENIQAKEADLVRFEQERKDILRGYE
ncbi:MAG: hypothetical protein WBC50_07870 [Dehalococcoidales bacterium]